MWLAGSNFQFILGWTWDFLPKSFSFQPKFFMKTIENTMVYHPRISKVRAIRGWIKIYGSIAITDNTLLFDCTNKFLIHLFQKYLWNDGTPAPVGFPHSIGVFYGSKGPRTSLGVPSRARYKFHQFFVVPMYWTFSSDKLVEYNWLAKWLFSILTWVILGCHIRKFLFTTQFCGSLIGIRCWRWASPR